MVQRVAKRGENDKSSGPIGSGAPLFSPKPEPREHPFSRDRCRRLRRAGGGGWVWSACTTGDLGLWIYPHWQAGGRRILPNARVVVNYWMMDDPTQPKPADLLAAMIDFRDAVAAQFARIDGQFARVDARFVDLEGRMDARFDRVDRRLARLDDRASAVEDRVSGVEGRMSTFEGQMSALQGQMSSLQGQMSTLHHGMSTLETGVHEISSRVKLIEGRRKR